jgi:hypothetical protein
MPGEILRIVLALAEGMVGWGSEDARALLAGSLVVTVRIQRVRAFMDGYAHHLQVRAVRWHVSFGQYECTGRLL